MEREQLSTDGKSSCTRWREQVSVDGERGCVSTEKEWLHIDGNRERGLHVNGERMGAARRCREHPVVKHQPSSMWRGTRGAGKIEREIPWEWEQGLQTGDYAHGGHHFVIGGPPVAEGTILR
ncbi:unnamed protein product [Lampetra planeri]